VNVSLPSGCCKTLSLSHSSIVSDLKLLAQKSFGQGFLRLVTEEGRVLTDLMETLPSVIQDGEHLTAIAQQPKLAASCYAFAMWCCGGDRVVTWGHPSCGGDSSAVRGQLRNVQQIQATSAAFAAILADRSVVTWGDSCFGGDSSEVRGQLRNVQQIQATGDAFAAILADGSVVTWGNQESGDCSTVQHQLRNVKEIHATLDAFAAILADGSVVTWGDQTDGANSSAVQHQLRNVQLIHSTRHLGGGSSGAFAAVLVDGSIVSWGDPNKGEVNSAVADQILYL
jgi:hypothetical protein